MASEHTPLGVPAVWGSVPQRNMNFTGRESLLSDLRERMTGHVTAVLPHALHGLGGVGKTQVAIEYAYRFASDYEVVWWIPADQSVLARSALASLAPRLGLANIAPERVEDAVRAVLDCLRRGEPYSRWLLIYDNADQPEEIIDLVPNRPISALIPHRRGDVLVTSRNNRWRGRVDTVDVDVFTRGESLEFLSRRVPGSGEADANRLAEELGDLPLALEQAGALQAETGMSVIEYIDLLNKEARQLLAENPPSDYPWPVAAAWSLSVARVREQMPFALDLLRRCAFFGPEPISREVLQRGQYVLGPPLRDSLGDAILVSRAMRELGRYSLAKMDNNNRTIQVHRLIQKLLRDEVPEDEADSIRHDVHLLLAAADPGDPELLETWPEYQDLLPHVGPSRFHRCPEPKVRRLARNVFRYLYGRGEFENCLSDIDQALEHWRATSRDDDFDVMALLGLKAWALWALGHYAQAVEIRKANLERARTVLGRDHEFTLDTTNGYGADLRARGEFVAAMKLDEELLERHRKVLGTNDSETLMVANNLAVDYCLNGRYERAHQLDERSYQGRRVLFGRDDHPAVLVSLGAIARDLRQSGDYAAAVEVGERTRAGFATVTRQGTLAESHPWVLQQSKEHSIALRKAGDLDGALRLAEEVFDKYRKGYDANHPDTLAAAITLSNSERAVGSVERAVRRTGDTVHRYAEIWGSDHPFTYGCLLDLAIARRLTGEHAAAAELLERALSGLRRTLGDEHHYTMMCLGDLAVAMAELGEVAAAVDLNERAVQRFSALLGDGHPHVLWCQANLALDLPAVDRADEAESLAASAKEQLVSRLGDAHPEVRDVLRGERTLYEFDPPPV